MNKYHLKKMLLILSFSGTMVLAAACSKKDDLKQPLSNQEIEQDLEDYNTMTKKIEEGEVENSNQGITKEETLDSSNMIENNFVQKEPTKTNEAKKRDLINRIEDASFNSTIKDIFKTIVKNSKNYDTDTIDGISIACDEYGKKFGNLYLCNAIMEATRKQTLEQRRGQKTSLENLKIFNNLDKKQKNLPKQISLMVHGSTYGKYKFYEGGSFIFLVTDQEDNILLVANNEKVKKVKGTRLHDFSKLLKAYDIKPQEKYTDEELYEDITFRLSKKINGSINKDSKIMETKDIVVVDSKHTIQRNIDKRYYFLKYQCPYLFDTKEGIYKDIFNPNANISICQDTSFAYTDYKQNISMYDPVCPGDKKAAYQPLSEFLSQKNIPIKKYISYAELSEIEKKVNKKDKKQSVKRKSKLNTGK